MATTPLLPLNGLKSAVASGRTDLDKIRSIASQTQKKIAEMSNRTQYTPAYIQTEVAKIRADGAAQAKAYLDTRQTEANLAKVTAQESLWTVKSFLERATTLTPPQLTTYDSSANTQALLHHLVQLSTLNTAALTYPRMATETLADAVESALARGDYAAAGLAYNELAARGAGGDDVAERAQNAVEQVAIPALVEAQEIITAAAHTSELLGYALASAETGAEDLGIRMESYQAMEKARSAAKGEYTL